MCVLTFSVINDLAVNLHGLMVIFVAMVAVSAMACLLRLAEPGAPSTTVMTGNLTSSMLSLQDGLSRYQPLMEGRSGR